MDNANMIRSFIFLVPGLAMIFIPKKVRKFQMFLLKIIPIKFKRINIKPYPKIGVVFLIISLGLFLFSLSL